MNQNKVPFKLWNNETKINFLQRRIIVHSIIYYNMNASCIEDKQFDKESKMLVALQNDAPIEVLQKTELFYVMKDFDGSTGFDLYDRLTPEDKEKYSRIAKCVHAYWCADKANKGR